MVISIDCVHHQCFIMNNNLEVVFFSPLTSLLLLLMLLLNCSFYYLIIFFPNTKKLYYFPFCIPFFIFFQYPVCYHFDNNNNNGNKFQCFIFFSFFGSFCFVLFRLIPVQSSPFHSITFIFCAFYNVYLALIFYISYIIANCKHFHHHFFAVFFSGDEDSLRIFFSLSSTIFSEA